MMLAIHLTLDGEGVWPDLLADPSDVVHLQDATWHLAALREGMASGRPSLALRLNLPDGLYCDHERDDAEIDQPVDFCNLPRSAHEAPS